MKFNPLIAVTFFLSLLVLSCKQHQEVRRPISHTSGSFMKKSIDRNKKLIASEEDQIKAVIKSNAAIKYTASSKGYWYSYEVKNELDTLTPKKGDIAFFDYEISDLKGAIIYSEQELKPQTYYVDKQDIMMGLRDGIKLMRKNEKVNFLFPSHIAYGYHGDNKKIGVNEPLICTVTLRDFISESIYKKQINIKPVAPKNSPTTIIDSPPQKPIKKSSPTPIKTKDTLKQ